VNVDVLRHMGHGQFPLEELRGLEREEDMKLLDRAAEVGMLTALGGGYYRIHPALPWFFRGLFKKYYEGREDEVTRAFVEAVSIIGRYYFYQYEAGHREVVSAIAAEEANLLCTRQLAINRSLWDVVSATMEGLYHLYDQTGRWMEWRYLIEETMPLFTDTKTDAPIPSLEEYWSIITSYRVKLAIRLQQLDMALRLQKKDVDWSRKNADLALSADARKIDDRDRTDIRNYIISLSDLARIQREMDDVECIKSYKEVIEKSETYGFRTMAGELSMSMANAYLVLAKIRNLDKAEWWYRHCLELTAKSDMLLRGQCLGSLGNLAYERFRGTQKAGKPEGKHLEAAREFYKQALNILPSNALNEIAIMHNSLGNLDQIVGMFDEALRHYQEAIRYADNMEDIYMAALCRMNTASNLANAGRLSDALEYARSALKKFKACGPSQVQKIHETEDLIRDLEKDLMFK